MKLRLTFWDIFVGLPAGPLIFMSTIVFGTLLRRATSLAIWFDLPILAACALMVGVLTGISRREQGLETALVAGVLSAGILGYLWLSADPGDVYSPLVFGLPGMVLSLVCTPLGGRLGMKLMKVR